MSKIYFNEIENFPAQWLLNYWAGAKVDERSIKDVESESLARFLRCHFFAGIGGWEIALREAGWPEDVPVWTGSCPCQPFSAAGKQKGTADERHLWPEFLRLIEANRPPHIFGEQVSGKKVTGRLFTPKAFKRLEPEARRAVEEEDSEAWLKHVQTDLEGLGYIVGSVSFPACCVGAPHARQRLYWYARYVGDTSSKRLEGRQEQSTREECQTTERSCGSSCQLAHGNHKYKKPTEPCGCSLVDRPSPTNGFWRSADWIICRDDKWRPVEPGSSPLADGILSRASKISAGIRYLGFSAKTFKEVLRDSKAILKVARASRNGQLSGYGNAIVIPQAVEFIQACMEEMK